MPTEASVHRQSSGERRQQQRAVGGNNFDAFETARRSGERGRETCHDGEDKYQPIASTQHVPHSTNEPVVLKEIT